jgi:deazaflavin-dependent oxidoreductase (nitroreductase family)
MAFPTFMPTFNRLVTNRLTRRFAGRVPPFAIVTHTGRRSGKQYRTPIMAFPVDAGFLVALTYGTDTDWLRNVRAGGNCTLIYRGRSTQLSKPHLLHRTPSELPLPRLVQGILRQSGVSEFLQLSFADGSGDEGDQV